MVLKADVDIVKSGAVCFSTDKLEHSGKYIMFSTVQYLTHSTGDITILTREDIYDDSYMLLHTREIVQAFSLPSEANKAYIKAIKSMELDIED